MSWFNNIRTSTLLSLKVDFIRREKFLQGKAVAPCHPWHRDTSPSMAVGGVSNTGRIAIDDNEALRKFSRWECKF